MSGVDVLAVMGDGASDYDESGHDGLADDMRKAMAAVEALVDCLGDVSSLLQEIDTAVRAEHRKNGAPQAKSVAGILNERLSAALRGMGGA